MTETRDIRSVLESAEQAAVAGDYASAERLLTDAAQLQEVSLGPLHPDLANTLNNLGVVCEIREKPVDAERYFRRAWEIAAASLEPGHPFVATSRKNLEDFCNSRGIAVDAPPAPLPVPADSDVPTSLPVASTEPALPTPSPARAADEDMPAEGSADDPARRPSHDQPRPVTSGGWARPVAIAALIAGALVITLIATGTWRGEPAIVNAPSEKAASVDEPIPATPETGDAIAPPPATTTSAHSPTPPPPAEKTRPVRTAPAKPPVVAAAQLCATLSTGGDWNCVPPGLPVSPGMLFFYSRLKSPADTTVQHRWYRGERLRQAVELRIRANTTDGYRTYSRHTVDSQGAADWRVELRTSDGVLLHEERFVVR